MNKPGVNQKPTISGWQTALDLERVRIATTVLPILIAVGTVFSAFFVGVYFMLDRPWQWAWMVFEIVQTPVLFILAYILARRGHLAATVYLTVLAINITAVIGPALVEGMVVPGIIAGAIAMMFGRLLAGRTENRIVVLVSGMAIATGIVFSILQVFEILPIATWIQISVALGGVVILVLLTALILDSRDRRYEDSLAQAEAYAAELNVQRATLEERTHDLARRTRYLEATAEVARDAASVLDQRTLLSRIVTLVSTRFGFYHTGIFLLDNSGEWAVLQAASSEGGQHMLARGHRLRVGVQGIVGYVTGRGEPRIALDVGADAVFFDNPDLPNTRSEMALPLRARGEIIGALDVQSTEPEAFGAEDVAVLQTLADQMALAISNAGLFEQAQESLEVERRAYGELGREAWKELLRAQPELGFLSDERGIYPAGELRGPQVEIALRTEETTRGEDNGRALAVPIKVRGQVIGVIDAHRPEDAGEWTTEDVTLLETLVEQLGVALDSARLYQDSQRRATRERLIGEVTSRVRASLDLETVLKTATDEIYQALGLDEIAIRLATDEADDRSPSS